MQSPIPRQSTHDQGVHRADREAGLDAGLAAMVAGARRRAVRDGDRQVDTAHLLHSLLESDPEVRAAFPDPAQLARLLAYLVQRSIGYGLRWQSGAEESGAGAAVPGVAGLSPLAASAMEDARARAGRRGGGPARGVDLLAAIVADPQARAVEVLRCAGADAREVLARLADRPEERVTGGDPSRRRGDPASGGRGGPEAGIR
ncbi:Clp protease N-terminal domain-containing protein [Streptomyces sp. NPDC085946]|uniref:Clp protease N-terminal domain-containing protein n=1 Tax=Streptomyces sp. NPDC085946 TaxID=3365744 RepID=UPI0037D66A31